MMRWILACGWLCATSAVAAPVEMAKLVTRDGREYQKVTIVGHDAIGIKIHHAGGMARLPFERLSDELQKKYQFDAAKAEQQKQAELQRIAEHEKAVAVQTQKVEIKRKVQVVQSSEAAKKLEYEKLKEFVRGTPSKISAAQAKRNQLRSDAAMERSKTRLEIKTWKDSKGRMFNLRETKRDKSGYAKASRYEREAEELAEQIKRDTALLAKAKERLAVISK